MYRNRTNYSEKQLSLFTFVWYEVTFQPGWPNISPSHKQKSLNQAFQASNPKNICNILEGFVYFYSVSLSLGPSCQRFPTPCLHNKQKIIFISSDVTFRTKLRLLMYRGLVWRDLRAILLHVCPTSTPLAFLDEPWEPADANRQTLLTY